MEQLNYNQAELAQTNVQEEVEAICRWAAALQVLQRCQNLIIQVC